MAVEPLAINLSLRALKKLNISEPMGPLTLHFNKKTKVLRNIGIYKILKHFMTSRSNKAEKQMLENKSGIKTRL